MPCAKPDNMTAHETSAAKTVRRQAVGQVAVTPRSRLQARRQVKSRNRAEPTTGGLIGRLPDALIVAVDPLPPFVPLLRLEGQGGDGPRIEALEGDRLAGFLAITVGAVLDTGQGR